MTTLFEISGAKHRPLQGVRIVECGVWHAGPGGDAIMADLGAEVIKVESFNGDPERTQARLGTVRFDPIDKADWSLLFEISNRNKKGICLDIASQEGREVLHKLVGGADIFMTNLRKSTIPALGIDYESLKKVNPKIIHISASGFGAEGPMSDVGAFDSMGQAVSGMLFIGGPDEPVVLQTIVLDQLTAIVASHAMLTALFARERHGYGQALHVSLYGSALWMMYANVMTRSIMKDSPPIRWDRDANPPLRNCYKCKDGKWLMGTNHPEQKYWAQFCALIGMPQLADDPRYATQDARFANIKELVAQVDAALLTRDRDEWLELFAADGLNFCPIQTIDDVINDPQALLNGYLVDVDHPSLGKVRVPGYPVQFSASGTAFGPAPDRGQHTEAVLADLGYSAADIARLKQTNAAR